MARIGSRRRFLQSLTKRERAILREYIRTMNDVRSAAQFTPIVEAVAANDLVEIGEYMVTRGSLNGLIEQFRQAFVEGGQQFAESIPKSARDISGNRLAFRFDVMDPRAEAWLAQNAAEFVQIQFQNQTGAIREVVSSGMRMGRGPRQTALDLVGRISKQTGRRQGGIIGLAENQAQWVTNAREQLLSGDPDQMRAYLRRKRRDRNLDGFVKRAIKENRPLASRDVDRLVGRYEDRLLQYRGETIARTESINAFAAGRHEAARQLVHNHGVPEQAMKRKWDATMDQVTRPDHASMNGTTVNGPDEPFTMPDESQMMRPLDSSLGAPVEQIVNCRCYEDIVVDFIEVQALAAQMEAI